VKLFPVDSGSRGAFPLLLEWRALSGRRLAGAVGLLFLLAAPRPLGATGLTTPQILVGEANFIVDCSFTEFAHNHRDVTVSADAYGALNVDRVYQRGPDWVRPGEAAMGAIGLMAAAAHLQQAGMDISRYNQVLDRFFNTWLVSQQQPVDTDENSPDAGGMAERVYYNVAGQQQKADAANAGVTGQMIAAMWKYYEYNVATGSPDAANLWLQQAWPLARQGGDFLLRCYRPAYRLVSPNMNSGDLWVSDSTFAAAAFRCLDQWALAVRDTASADYAPAAGQIAAGLQAMEDHSDRASFCRFRDSAHSYSPTYGDQIDQLCFLPYEADVLDPGESFARAISDWWTNGSGGIQMTPQTTDPADWRYFGTHLRHLFAGSPDNDGLYPGAALQLAKVEWKSGQKTGDPVLLNRARQRLQWVLSATGSDLWFGSGGRTEAGVPNGVVDWRDASNFGQKAEDWERFLDTSAYLIEAVLMLDEGVDTRYIPG
jgi:hypothetical protein